MLEEFSIFNVELIPSSSTSPLSSMSTVKHLRDNLDLDRFLKFSLLSDMVNNDTCRQLCAASLKNRFFRLILNLFKLKGSGHLQKSISQELIDYLRIPNFFKISHLENSPPVKMWYPLLKNHSPPVPFEK